MGGDHGPPGDGRRRARVSREDTRGELILVGRENDVRKAAQPRTRTIASDRITVRAASEVVEMHEPPADALRRKKDSSMRVAIDLVKDGAAQACVSAGNTGALMAISRFVLKTLPGIDRPAIASQLPTRNGVTTALDLGANVNCTPSNCVQFAVMGSALVAAVDGIERPTVGLLNIGEEDIKGNDVVKQTARAAESVGPQLLRQRRRQRHLQGHGRRHRLRRLRRQRRAEDLGRPGADAFGLPARGIHAQSAAQAAGVFALPVIKAFKRRVDPRRYNGATLIGFKGIVVKSHGSADAFAFQHALKKRTPRRRTACSSASRTGSRRCRCQRPSPPASAGSIVDA